ncbi:hypothetical protein AAGG52_08890 [Bacillus licheniformis]
MLLAFMIIPDVLNNKAYAYMTIDINPSFELTLNKNCEVIDLVPLNEDGKDLMDSIKNWEKSDFKEVISEIVEDSDKSGYVTESKEVLIATVYENNEDDTYKATVKSEIDDVAKKYEQQNYKMEAVESDLDTRAKAQKEGISTGRYIRSHKDELEDKNKDDDNEDSKDDQQQEENTGEKEKAVKEEDQPEQHADDEESDTEDHPDGEKPSDQDQSQSDQEMEKEKESNSLIPKTLRNITIMTKTVSRRRKECRKAVPVQIKRALKHLLTKRRKSLLTKRINKNIRRAVPANNPQDIYLSVCPFN